MGAVMRPMKTFVLGCALLGGLAGAASAADDRDICQKESGDVAIAACNRAINSGKFTGKSLAIVYINRGAEWKAKKENDKALADYTIAINLDPSIPAIYNNRANIFRERGELDRAIADYSTAIRLDPLYTAAFTNRGLAYEQKNMLDKAREDFQASLSVPVKHNDGEWAHKTASEHLEQLKGK
jgi:tetratricopeptide (TPR) repeat protein